MRFAKIRETVLPAAGHRIAARAVGLRIAAHTAGIRRAALAACIGMALLPGIWALLPACVSASAPTVSAADKRIQDFVGRITQANRIEALIEKYGSVSAEYRHYYPDMTIRLQKIYRDNACYIDELGNDLWMDEGGEVYGFDTEEAEPWRALFTDGVYEDFQKEEVLHDWELLADMAGDGLITCEETEFGAAFFETVTEAYEHNDYPIKPGDRLRDEFETDPATGEIVKYRRFLLQEGEEELLLERAEFVYGADKPQPDKKLREKVFCEDAEDIRTVTLIADAGTEQEKIYRQTVKKGCQVEIYLGLEYDDRIYRDPECTAVYKAEKKDDEKDITVYTCTL